MASSTSIQLTKAALRKELKQRLKSISVEERVRQSQVVTDLVINSPEYQNSRRISVYLNMPEEVGTYDLLSHIFRTGRQCFVPRFTKDRDMEMFEVLSLEDYETLPFTFWNIRQPEGDHARRPEAMKSGGLDLIILPGLGFSFNSKSGDWLRLGRGRGYYDTYLEKILRQNSSPPITIALAFKEQILDSLPVDPHDRSVNQVFHA